MADANIRVINITLNPFELRNEDSNFEIRCGENVRLVFSLPEDVDNLQLTESGTLQVEAISALNGFKALAKEGTYTVGSVSELNAQIEFTTEQTAYGSTQAGAYNLIVALKDSIGNVVLSGVVPFNLYDVGYDGIVEPPESFRDEVLEAAEDAQTAATQAQAAATQAQTSESNAAASATQAQASAQAAATSQTAAAQSETNAAGSASVAQASATAASQSESNALASKNAAEAAAQIAQETDAGELMLSKLGAGQLWFNRGVLSVPSFANLSISLPISLCIEYDVDSWSGLGITTNGGIMFLATRDVEYTEPAQFKGFYLRYYENKQLSFHCANADSTPLTAQFSALTTNGNDGLPTGRHTLVVCVGGTIEGGKPSHFAWYLDGLALPQTITQQTMTAPDITSTRALVVAQADNYANAASIGGAKVPIRLARARIFNFQMDADGAPYSVADYAAGKPVPPKFYDPAAAQRALLALEDYTIARNTTTRLVKDISGNAYDATVVESGGSGDTAWTGTVKGSRDSAVAAFVDEIKTQINQANG